MAVVHWDEAVMKISGLLLPIFFGLLLVCMSLIITKSRSLRIGSLLASGGILAVGLVSAVGLMLSSVLVYVSYRPFGGIVQNFVRTGADGGVDQLNELLDYAQYPLFKPGPRYQLHFWLVLVAICVVILLVIAAQHFRHHLRAGPAS
jgi:hypothetical protein